MQDDSICSQSEDFTSSDDSFCLQVRIQHVQAESKFPTTPYLITNLAYKLKLHQKRSPYPRARIDTCTDVNIMPDSVYKLLLCDPDLKKLASSRLEIGTYTTNTLKLVGSFTFYLVHPDTKHLQEVPSEIQCYWTFREELTIENGIVLKGIWIVVPHQNM